MLSPAGLAFGKMQLSTQVGVCTGIPTEAEVLEESTVMFMYGALIWFIQIDNLHKQLQPRMTCCLVTTHLFCVSERGNPLGVTFALVLLGCLSRKNLVTEKIRTVVVTHDTLASLGDMTADKTLVEIFGVISILGSIDMESPVAVQLVRRVA